MKPILLKSCPKAYDSDLDKAKAPAQTVADVLAMLQETGLDILAETRRIDNGRLNIPVYMSVCGKDSRAILPARKQMGKGSSPEQAQASALMELIERYGFFSFWQDEQKFTQATWAEAEARFGENLIPVREILASVNDNLSEEAAREILNAVTWKFYPATRLIDGQLVWLPLDWFKLLSEFNGSSAGNTPEESLLQGIAELVERHASALADKNRPVLPTIQIGEDDDPVLKKLVAAFTAQGIVLILKDMTMGMPMPTVAALAWDPATFPDQSEIVFTAGTASSPARAAIRAITEVAQLGGDFNTGACYEASGLPKFSSIEQCQWLLEGPEVGLNSLPSLQNADILVELQNVLEALQPISVYAVDTSIIGPPSHWAIAPGLQFRERDANQSLGLFVGRKLAEEAEPEKAQQGLRILAKHYPDAHFLPFFAGLLALRTHNYEEAAQKFIGSTILQPDAEAKALAAFYAGYAYARANQWSEALPWLKDALRLSPLFKEAANLAGVACFKKDQFQQAEEYFNLCLKIDKGSAADLANRGICRKMRGNRAEALADLREALALDPTLDYARPHLQELQEN